MCVVAWYVVLFGYVRLCSVMLLCSVILCSSGSVVCCYVLFDLCFVCVWVGLVWVVALCVVVVDLCLSCFVCVVFVRGVALRLLVFAFVCLCLCFVVMLCVWCCCSVGRVLL